MQDGGVLSDSGFPRDGGMANEEEHAKTSRTWCKHEHLIQHTFIRSTVDRLGAYTFEACVFGAVRVRYDVEEVVVHGSSWEVVVLVS